MRKPLDYIRHFQSGRAQTGGWEFPADPLRIFRQLVDVDAVNGFIIDQTKSMGYQNHS